MSEASLWGGVWADYLHLVSMAPNLFFILLLLLITASTLWLLLFRPAPALGPVAASGNAGDTDFANGTPFWSARTFGARCKLLAPPVGHGLLRLVLVGSITFLLFATLTYSDLCAFSGGVVFCNNPFSATAIIAFILVLPLIALAVLRRFWVMGRKAGLTIVEADGDIGLHPWWSAELGLQAGEKLALRAGRSFAKSKKISLRSDLDRGQIALPSDLRTALDLELGRHDLVLLPNEPFPVWPVVPLAFVILIGVALIQQPVNSHVAGKSAAQIENKASRLPLCLMSNEMQDIWKICKPLLDTPLEPDDKALVQFQLARMNFLSGDEQTALGDLNTILKSAPRLWQAYALRAEVSAHRRDYDDALKDLDAALAIVPDREVFRQRGLVLDFSGRMPNGIADFTQAIELADPIPTERGAIIADRAVSYLEAGQYEAALRDLKRAADYGFKNEVQSYNAGRAHFMLSAFQEAAADLQQALQSEPSDAYAALMLYLSRQRVGQDGAAQLRAAGNLQNSGSWQAVLVAAVIGDAPFESVKPGTYYNNDAPQLKNLQDKAQACELNFYIGEKLLGQGDKANAIAHFKATLATGISEYIEYSDARSELTRLGVTP